MHCKYFVLPLNDNLLMWQKMAKGPLAVHPLMECVDLNHWQNGQPLHATQASSAGFAYEHADPKLPLCQEPGKMQG